MSEGRIQAVFLSQQLREVLSVFHFDSLEGGFDRTVCSELGLMSTVKDGSLSRLVGGGGGGEEERGGGGLSVWRKKE